MISSSKGILVSLIFLLIFANAVTFSANTYLGDISFSVPLTINEGYFLALVNGNSYSFTKDLHVKGSLFVGDINPYGDGFSTTFDGSTITNDGLIVVDSRNLTSGLMSVSWGGSFLTNNGKMYFEGLNSKSNSFTLNPSISLANAGLMSFGQDVSSNFTSIVHLQSKSFVNIGTICLKNVKASLESSIAGNGCITIGENSVYAIPIQSSSGTIGPQTMYLSSPSSMLYIGSYGSAEHVYVRGFGNGNYLTFRTAIAGYSYNPSTGILTISAAVVHKIDIGTGYNKRGFSVKTVDNHVGFNFINNAIVYNATAPNGFPSACMPCNPAPWIPIISSASSSSSSFITSSSSPKPSAVISYIPGIVASDATKFTSTSYTTDSNGSSPVDIVVVATPVQSTVTAYTTGSAGSASALSSYISYTTDSNGSTKAIGVIVVETPAVSQITSYIPGIVASDATQSTITSYTTNSNGSSSPVGIVVVATPVQSTVTAYSAGMVGSVSALSSYISYTTDSNGSTKAIASALSSYISYTTDSNGSTKAIGVIVVETPAVSQLTSYIPGIVASAAAQFTSTSYTTNSNGSSSPVGIIVVATPVQSTVTAYTTGSAGSASALSSYISYTTDSNGNTKAIGVIVVETPAVSQITSYIPGIVASAAAQFTSTSYTTNSNGSSSPVGIVVVATPVQSTVTAYSAGMVGSVSALSSYISYTTDSNGSTKAIGVIVVETPIYGNSTNQGGKAASTLSSTLVALTTVINGVTLTTTYCPEPSATSKTSMTALIGHSSLESVYTNSKNQQKETDSFSAVSYATPVTSIVSTTTGPAFTSNENQPMSRNSRASITAVIGSIKNSVDITSEAGTVVDTVKSGRSKTSPTSMVPQVSQYVSEQISSSPIAITAPHEGAPSLVSYEGKGSTMYMMKWSVAHCIGLLLFMIGISEDKYPVRYE
ncbi:hypothetical protein RI543_002933 [Arxiozyma heterogenica]|uniref:Hyphally-regulated cell wall protein N-terminal domain-containing protein n=1 Tax=Arxiozyma heterogenica TaxID=278026 RepID=A0AAN7WIU9_9SACH|nr:hypothetical protein RI543_002933 [Kazachstania heterogenica]